MADAINGKSDRVAIFRSSSTLNGTISGRIRNTFAGPGISITPSRSDSGIGDGLMIRIVDEDVHRHHPVPSVFL